MRAPSSHKNGLKIGSQAPYPKPKQAGGVLIRRLIATLKEAGVELPLTSHILIAVSGGADSMALSHLLLKYGRRVVDRSKISLLHVDHGWRDEESRKDARFVGRFAKRWGVPLVLHRLRPEGGGLEDLKASMKGRSWEDAARSARKAIFEKEAQRQDAKIVTAHQADDLAETLLWRLFTGAARTHGGGIALRQGTEVRPLLRARKQLLKAYLKEERQSWREDSTNNSGRFLRSKMRRELVPVVEALFPKAIEHLVDLALEAQMSGKKSKTGSRDSDLEWVSRVLGTSGVRMKRAHWSAILKGSGEDKKVALDLPGGWKLSRSGARSGN